jgi:hypothetical protein
MKQYLKRSLLFSTPIILCFIFIFLIDPYEFINISHIINSDIKFQVLRRSDESLPRGHILWKTLHFKRRPVKNIIIGDSQGVGFDATYISNLSGKEYYNFCVTGASYKTMFKIFWFTAETTKLERVYFQVGFMNYNASRSYDIFHFAQDYFDKPYLYFTTKEILIDSYYNFIYSLTKNDDLIKYSFNFQELEIRDARSKEILEMLFKNYNYPTEYYQELKKISEYCKNKNIQLYFIIFPMFDAVKNYIVENNLDKMNQQFKDDIKSLGYTFDFDVRSDFTKNRDNFIDYFHPIPVAYIELSQNIWAN